ncbi:MAG: GAF domain-containing protein [Anaerolineales bacterium]|nr:GAF domain-containing protein [Anaerolineales bacterium]
MTTTAFDLQQAKLAALYDVSARLGTTLNLNELLNYVMDATIKLTGAERGLLVLFNEMTGQAETVAARHVEQEHEHIHGNGISRTVINRAVSSGRPILTNNAQEDERFASQQSVVGYQLRSIMVAPLRARDRVIGAAYVDNRLLSGVFEQADLDLLMAFANQAAMALENARLFAQTDQQLARRVQELNLFQQIDQELNHSLNLNRVLTLALDWAVGLTEADNGSIGLFETHEDEKGDPFEVLRILGYAGSLNPEELPIVQLDHPIVAAVLESQEIVRSDDVTKSQAIDGTAAAVQLAVPIRRDAKIIGLITLESQDETSFRPDDVAFVGRLADRAAVAIENARLYEEIQMANDAKSRFISMVTHELRVPLTSIKGYADLIAKGLAGPISDQQGQFLSVISRNLTRMSTLIQDLSDLNRIESGRMRFKLEEFDLRETVEDVADSLQERFNSRQQNLKVEMPQEPIIVYADRLRTGQVLTNLVSNANKYTPDNGRIIVRVNEDAGKAAVAVMDNGLGISEEDQAKLFSQFFRSEDENVREQVGWGLGLSIVKMLVEAQGGEISVESALRRGSKFAFTLPIAAIAAPSTAEALS